MKTAKLSFSSEKEITEYISECERAYKNGVDAAFEAALGGGRLITLAGPTCSGKTTTALLLDKKFKEAKRSLHTLSIDDFYIERDILDARSRALGIPLDYDSPSTIDFEYLERVVESIEKGGRVTLPRFDFALGSRVGYYGIECTPEDIFLFEGIQAVYPECTSLFSGHAYTPLFISAGEDIAYGETVFTKRELRLLRRLVRDKRSRNTEAEKTLTLWESVCENEDKNIFPNVTAEHIRIDSSLCYEVSVIKPFALPLLYGIDEDSKNYPLAKTLTEKLLGVPEIDAKYVPKDSVFREFIG